jgi:hypothetical protein
VIAEAEPHFILQGLRILLVEDEAMVAMLMEGSRATLSCWTISSPQRAGNREAVEAAGAKLKQRRANPWFTSEGRSTAAP